MKKERSREADAYQDEDVQEDEIPLTNKSKLVNDVPSNQNNWSRNLESHVYSQNGKLTDNNEKQKKKMKDATKELNANSKEMLLENKNDNDMFGKTPLYEEGTTKERQFQEESPRLYDGANNLVLFKNEAMRLEEKNFSPTMSEGQSQAIRIEDHPREESRKKTRTGEDYYIDESQPPEKPILRHDGVGENETVVKIEIKETGNTHLAKKYDETSSPTSIEPISSQTITHKSMQRISNDQYKEDNQKTNEDLLEELRSIAKHEVKNLQNITDRMEEIYFRPPLSPTKRQLKSNIEFPNTIEEVATYKPRQPKPKVAIKEEASIEAADGVSSFNDFNEDIFKFNENTKMYNCPWKGCDKVFPSLSRIKRHYIIHTDIKPFKCLNLACNRRFSRKDNMLQHYRVHCPFANQTNRNT
ncbi:transcriptional repressor [Glugoides intestinalis]